MKEIIGKLDSQATTMQEHSSGNQANNNQEMILVASPL